MQFCPVIFTVQFWAENCTLLITGYNWLCGFASQMWNKKECFVRPATLIVSVCCVTTLTAPRMNSAYTSSQSMTTLLCWSHSLERCRNLCLLRNTVQHTDKWQVCRTVMFLLACTNVDTEQLQSQFVNVIMTFVSKCGRASVVVWCGGGMLVSIKVVALHWARLVLGLGHHSWVWVTFTPSWYLINHSGELSLAISPGKAKWVHVPAKAVELRGTPCGALAVIHELLSGWQPWKRRWTLPVGLCGSG